MRKLFLRCLTCLLSVTMLILSAQALTLEQTAELLELLYIDEVPAEALEKDTIQEMVSALGDPYTQYYTAEEYQLFLDSMSDSSLVGIGVVLTQTGLPVAENGLPIDQILENSPAATGGLMVGDLILAVDGQSIIGMDLESVTSRIRGEEGSTVTITYERNGEIQDVSLTRATVVVAATTSELIDGHIGYIQCTTFGNETAQHFREGLETYADQANVWIVDLRSNLGGSAVAATECAGYFTGPGYMSILRDGSDHYSAYTHTDEARTIFPVIVLVDEKSASASEIFASTIQSQKAGIVVGTRTYGKGVAQIVGDQENYPDYFPDGDALKITAYRFYTPNGNTTDQVGVIPDLVVDDEFTLPIARLLASDPDETALGGTLRLHRTWRWTIDLAYATQEENLSTLEALLNVLPYDEVLYFKENSASDWATITCDVLAQGYGLELTHTDVSELENEDYAHILSAFEAYGLMDISEKVTSQDYLHRDELCQIFASVLRLKEATIENPYSDVPNDGAYTQAILAMTSMGFVNGVDGGAFDPNGLVTQQQLITIMGRVAQFLNFNFYDAAREMSDDALEQEELLKFADWAKKPAWLLSLSQTNLFGVSYSLLWTDLGEIEVNEFVTLQETAYMLYNVLTYCTLLNV